MTIWLDVTIYAMTTALAAYALWLGRPKPRRLTKVSDYRRRRLWHARYQTTLLLAAIASIPLFVDFQARRHQSPTTVRAMAIAILGMTMFSSYLMRRRLKRRREVASESR